MQFLTFLFIGFAVLALGMAYTSFERKLENLERELLELEREKQPAYRDAGTSSKCPVGFKLYGGSCYLFNTNKMKFRDAAGECSSLHPATYLVQVDNFDENNYLKRESRATPESNFWISLTDIESNEFIWWRNAESLADTSFSDWNINQPTRTYPENCATLDRNYDYEWADSQCEQSYSFICEKKAV